MNRLSIALMLIFFASCSGSQLSSISGILVKSYKPSLSYSGATGTSVTLGNSTTITPMTLNDGGKTATCSTSPDLPTGLTLHSSTCVISGTPVTILSATTYTITIANASSSARATVSLSIAQTPDTWYSSAPFEMERKNHTATLLDDGKVLIVGGLGPGGEPREQAEVYDPSLNQWVGVDPPMTDARVYHSATKLPDGRVLVAGGEDNGSTTYYRTVEIYNSTLDQKWQGARSMIAERSKFTATLLDDGKVLIVGGSGNCGLGCARSTAEIYDPASDTWTYTRGRLNSSRHSHQAIKLSNGNVLIGGGNDGSNQLLTTEIYDVATERFSIATPYLGGSTNHTVTLDASTGTVIVAGGLAGIPVDTIAIFDDLGGFTFTTFHLPTTRSGHTASLLSNGNILFTGGMKSLSPGDILRDAELFSLASFGILPSPSPMNEPRVWHTATVLEDGRVLVIGGETTAQASNSCEIYQP